ncbi:hypothetical protein BN1058_01853 [Paraliobacillus sp. PM-2]|uniref:hypothetical protein n=1 Tax=Paraliobacillus sp. PM-2 TaxID=1462524 RepID=UPI00061C1D0B|nr:hypothetical protein [Paraliobacillus sp. PM-2]CQR47530.1 hypothetical protein BN1058_01853 [Paraliobacillus sp. PM-2]
MFAQLFLGIYFVVKGIVEHFARKPNLFLSEDTIQRISKENLPSYLKRVGKTHIFLGIFIAIMGQIEHWYNPEHWIFILTYIVLAFACLGIIVYLNKKYSGDYILR